MNQHDIAVSYLNSFSSGDPDAIAEHVTDDFQNIQTGALGTACVGADVYRQRLANFLASFENLKYEVEDIIVDGDRVAVAYRMKFTSNNRTIDISGAMLMTIRDGRIAMRKDYWDGLAYQNQVNAET